MNLILETLNQWSVQALRVAWPMLWQSSLLIGLLFAGEALLRHRVRAAVRYALWLVMLLKLVLPPALALPTGLGWWLRPTAVRPTPAVAFSVTFGEGVMPPVEAAAPETTAPLPEPAATLGVGGWVLLGASAVSLGLLFGMLLRWRQVARDLQEAAVAPDSLCKLAEELRRSLGLRRRVQIRLTEQAVSPGVCGLFQPTILLPRLVTERLEPSQLRAVLLHELIHLRRGDVWVNCGQALLQLVYWWHPLLWLANARIRQVREEAVDDAVMLALREEAETYAPTLLEVARLALQRRVPSLGLVGILESRSALRQRIQRLLEFHPPRRAGLTLASAFVVVAFAALAVPMGEAPKPKQQPFTIQAGKPASATTAGSLSANAVTPTVSDTGSAALGTNSSSAALPAGSHSGTNTFPLAFELGSTNLAVPAGSLSTRTYKVDLERLLEAARKATTQPGPVGTGLPKSGLKEFFEAKGADLTPPKSYFLSYGERCLWVRASARDFEIIEKVLSKAGVLPAPGSTNSAAAPSESRKTSPPLYSRTFKVDPNSFVQGLQGVSSMVSGAAMTGGGGGQGGAVMFLTKTNATVLISEMARAYFSNMGVTLDPPKSIFFNDREGRLFVRGEMKDLDIVERILPQLNAAHSAPPQIDLKVKLLELPEAEANAFCTRFAVTNAPGAANWSVKLSAAETAAALARWDQAPEADVLAAPEVTTLSGRQVQMRVQEVRSVVIDTNASMPFIAQPLPPNQDSTGPAFDFLPTVGADGFTISTPVIFTLTEFLGYQKPATKGAAAVPQLKVRQLTSQVSLWDGQTVVLGGLVSESISTVKDKVPVLGDLPLAGGLFRSQTTTTRKKHLLVLLTPRLVDPTGNPVHTDELLRTFPQPKR